MWTRFPELDGVLSDLVAGVRGVLGPNLVGVYLHGSFAVGDADEWSDADFLVVTEEQLGEGDRPALDELHRHLFALPGHWSKHLEGSYVDRELLRRPDPTRTKLLFLDHGSQELAWDDHCNTAYVRWAFRKHGIALDGPPAADLVDPVSPDVLREEARARLPEWVEWAESIERWNRWYGPYIVLGLCRVLWTIEQGTVVSKQDAGEWAMGELDPVWAGLIRSALDDRPDPVGRWHTLAPPGEAERVLAFVRYASSARS